MQARRGLGSKDTRLVELQRLAEQGTELTEEDRFTIVSCVRSANEELRRLQLRPQSFRNVIAVTAGFPFLLVGVVALLSIVRPTVFPVCFPTANEARVVVACPAAQSNPFPPYAGPGTAQGQTRPLDVSELERVTVQGYDIVIVLFVGFLGAALSTAVSIKNIRGSSDPFSIPVALSVLKLPTGALTALLGLVLIRAGLVPILDQ